MAHEVINLDLLPLYRNPRRAHTPVVFRHPVGRAVVATVAGFERSSGLVIVGSDNGYNETDWEKTNVAGERKMTFGMASLVTGVELEKDLDHVGGVAPEDVELSNKIMHAAEATTWLAIYGYRETFRDSEVLDLPAYKGAVYLGVEPGSVPSELQSADEIRRIPYPGITRTSGYDNPAWYNSIRDSLPQVELAAAN